MQDKETDSSKDRFRKNHRPHFENWSEEDWGKFYRGFSPNFRNFNHGKNWGSDSPARDWWNPETRREFRKTRHHKRRFMFFRFWMIFGGIILWVGLVIFLLVKVFQFLFRGLENAETGPWLITLGLLVLCFAFLFRFSRRAYRNIISQLSDIVEAADSLAQGDFSVRIPLVEKGEFNNLAVSFNNMVVELERMDKQRRNLTADIAHELRTPIQIIQGNLEGILDGVYKADEEHIQSTLDETRLLARLVSDLRDLSLAESGELTLNYEEISLFDFADDVFTSFSPKAEQCRLQFFLEKKVEISEVVSESEIFVEADPDRLHQVLGNLLSNAIRFTPEGGEVLLVCSAKPEGVVFQVHDTGKGISEEDLPFVFDRFWQGDHSRSHQDGSGTGLGLAISQKFVEAHGGYIDVRSEVGKGTLFTVKLPYKPTEQN